MLSLRELKYFLSLWTDLVLDNFKIFTASVVWIKNEKLYGTSHIIKIHAKNCVSQYTPTCLNNNTVCVNW